MLVVNGLAERAQIRTAMIEHSPVCSVHARRALLLPVALGLIGLSVSARQPVRLTSLMVCGGTTRATRVGGGWRQSADLDPRRQRGALARLEDNPGSPIKALAGYIIPAQILSRQFILGEISHCTIDCYRIPVPL